MASPNPYSYAIRAGDTLFLSGLIPRNGKDNTVVSGDVATQTRAVLDNAKELLEAAGLSFPHLVSARVFLPDLKDFAEFNRVYREIVGADRPARATVGANLTSPAYKVEMTFVASAARAAGNRRGPAEEPEPQPGRPRRQHPVRVGAAGGRGGGDGRSRRADARHLQEARRRCSRRRGFARTDVRDLLVYVTDEEAAKAAMAECRAAFGAKTAITPVKVGLAAAGARVEIMTLAERG